ncbi:MAG: hypothetical protein ABI685_07160 [Ferruginibacter sp.]
MANKVNFKLRRRFLDNIPQIPNSKVNVKIEGKNLNISLPIDVKIFSESDSLFEYRKTAEGQPLPVRFNELYLEPIVTKILEDGKDKEYSSSVKITAVFVVDVKKPIEED